MSNILTPVQIFAVPCPKDLEYVALGKCLGCDVQHRYSKNDDGIIIAVHCYYEITTDDKQGDFDALKNLPKAIMEFLK